MPPKIINQINTFGKSFKFMTLDTVKGFLADSKKSKFKINGSEIAVFCE